MLLLDETPPRAPRARPATEPLLPLDDLDLPELVCLTEDEDDAPTELTLPSGGYSPVHVKQDSVTTAMEPIDECDSELVEF